MTDRSRYASMLSTIRLRVLSCRDWIENAERATGRDKRPPEWFSEQRGVKRDLEVIEAELAIIAANPASYEAWRATVARPKGDAA